MDKPQRNFLNTQKQSLQNVFSKVYPLGKIAGLRFSLKASVFPVFVLLWVILAIVGIWLLKLPPLGVIVGALIAALLHYLSEMVHQFGHSIAAQMTGHPMSGVLLWGFLGTSLYPPKEKKLPAAVHIRRATGGPIASALLTLLAGIISLGLNSTGGILMWLMIFVCLDNLLVFTLGSLLPLKFTDGGTLLYWRNK